MDEAEILKSYREVKNSKHGRLMIEVRDGLPQLMEITKKKKLS